MVGAQLSELTVSARPETSRKPRDHRGDAARPFSYGDSGLNARARRIHDDDLSAVAERGIAATRQLAKRQLTWLRGMPALRVACDDAQAPAQVLAQARQWLATPA